MKLLSKFHTFWTHDFSTLEKVEWYLTLGLLFIVVPIQMIFFPAA